MGGLHFDEGGPLSAWDVVEVENEPEEIKKGEKQKEGK
jgi:hypothetical protein